tara:strand:- start:1424 stop:2785 length:1362 start_codon:yes stop_codon:yes gene_type:complete
MPSTSKTEATKSILPSSYDIISVKLTLSNSNVIEIKELVASLEIVESIFAPVIRTSMRIIDGFGLLTDGHVVGGEKISILIGRFPLDSDEAESFKINVVIAEIHDHTTPKPGLQAYSFTCLSEHAFVNNATSINRSFDGTITDLISNICTNDLNTKLDNIEEKSSDAISGIYPDLKPYDAITWLLRNSTDEGTPYFFYETIQDGLQFNSYKQLNDKEVYREYNNSSFYKSTVATPGHYNEAKRKIIKMSSELNTSIYELIGKGAYSSTVQTLDISTKKYTSVNNSYKESFEKLNPRGKMFSDNIQFNNTQLVNNHKSKEFFITKNSKSFKGRNNYHNVISNSISDKTSQFASLSFMGLDIFLYGDFNLAVGNKVNLQITKSTDVNIQESNRKTGMQDLLLSGNYMVTSIAHVFDGTEYKCDVGIQKDSLNFDLDSEIKIGSSQNTSSSILRNG